MDQGRLRKNLARILASVALGVGVVAAAVVGAGLVHTMDDSTWTMRSHTTHIVRHHAPTTTPVVTPFDSTWT